MFVTAFNTNNMWETKKVTDLRDQLISGRCGVRPVVVGTYYLALLIHNGPAYCMNWGFPALFRLCQLHTLVEMKGKSMRNRFLLIAMVFGNTETDGSV